MLIGVESESGCVLPASGAGNGEPTAGGVAAASAARVCNCAIFNCVWLSLNANAVEAICGNDVASPLPTLAITSKIPSKCWTEGGARVYISGAPFDDAARVEQICRRVS